MTSQFAGPIQCARVFPRLHAYLFNSYFFRDVVDIGTTIVSIRVCVRVSVYICYVVSVFVLGFLVRSCIPVAVVVVSSRSSVGVVVVCHKSSNCLAVFP